MPQNFDEQQLEKLLQRLPQVQDPRDPADIFATLEDKLDIDDKPKKKRVGILPFVASAAAVVLFIVLASSFYNGQSSNSAMDSSAANESNAMKKSDQHSIAGFEDKAINSKADQANLLAKQALQSHVVREVPKGSSLITIGIPDESGQVIVPVSFMTNQPRFVAINNIASQVLSQEWGLSAYLLADATFKKSDTGNVNIDFSPAKAINGSAEATLLLDSIKQTLSSLQVEQAELSVAGKPGVDLGNYGVVKSVTASSSQLGYYKYQKGESLPAFLVPQPLQAKDITAALQALTEQNSNVLQPLVQKDVIERIEVDQQQVNLYVANNAALAETEDTLMMIEAILLTAKSYGFAKVQFYATTKQIGQYDLTKPIAVPIAANPMPYVPGE